MRRLLFVLCLVLAATFAPAGAAQAAGYHAPRCYDNGSDRYVTRADVLARARSWVGAGVVYDQGRCYGNSYGDYRTDCSGFVAMAWGLGGLGDIWGTVNLDERSTRIAASQLAPGDALLRYTGDPAENHVALFVRWADAAHTKPVVLEQSGGPGRAVERTWTWGYSGYVPVRYHRIGLRAPASVYGVLDGGRLTYSQIEPGSGRRLKTVVSDVDAVLGFTPKALATLNFNTLLVTSVGGQLYRVDIVTNNNALVFHPPVPLGGGWTHDHLAYDGHGHLFGIAGGVLRRYDVTAAKPASLSGNTVIDSGFTLKTLTATGADWILGTTAGGELLSYRIRGYKDWSRYELRSSTWQTMTHLMSPGGGIIYGRTGSGGLNHYLDPAPHDGSGADLHGLSPVDEGGWTQALLSAQPTG